MTAEFEDRLLVLLDGKYRLVGVRFYNTEDENAFRAELDAALHLTP